MTISNGFADEKKAEEQQDKYVVTQEQLNSLIRNADNDYKKNIVRNIEQNQQMMPYMKAMITSEQRYQQGIEMQKQQAITPSDIIEQRRYQSQIEQAKAISLTPVNGGNRVSVYSESKQLVIYTAFHQVSSLQIVDEYGNPYPITYSVLGNPDAFKVDKAPDQNKNTLFIQPNKESVPPTNMLVTLAGYPQVISLQIIESKENYDQRFILRMPVTSPTAPKQDVGEQKIVLSDLDLMFSIGAPPKDATYHDANIPNTDIWTYKGEMYLKTRYDLTYPNFQKRIPSNGTGYILYILKPTSMVMLAINGVAQQYIVPQIQDKTYDEKLGDFNPANDFNTIQGIETQGIG
ncbi:DotH/IcmK family type IV secretion protein [Cysteiniphilum sp. SYW-8]|nr:DotH/IcmK family type IV secretion protein [Cysteiniphilum sp. SYW-8]